MTTYYAIGDVHGMYDMLFTLMKEVVEDVERTEGDSRIVFLGDYVDRGPASAAVIELVRQFQANGDIALMGNHEDMMLQACKPNAKIADRQLWISNRGKETLDSFGGDVPTDVVEWLASLHWVFEDSDAKIMFVHAGIDPDIFARVPKECAIWTRDHGFFDTMNWSRNPHLDGYMIVHGHTPDIFGVRYETVPNRRLNVDTGACFGHEESRLTCAKIGPLRDVELIQVDADLNVTRKPAW